MMMMKTLENSPMPNHKMAMDTQAMGGMGLNRSKSGLTMPWTVLFKAMNRPRGTATTLARIKPMMTRWKLAQMWPQRLVPANFMPVRRII